ncbi:MAG: hypothetical protein JF588_07705 [Caulobacterales bacterium]|nr:hypothetical protein [Caulobacterales bacterium]
MLFPVLALIPATRTEPSSLLKLLAGEFAAQVAATWPEPHAAFLAAPAARRHLTCLALALGRDLPPIAERLLGGRLRHAIRLVLDPAPSGLERLLGRLGELAWDAEDYRTLLRLLAQRAPAKVLRHAQQVEPGAVRRLAGLPEPMGEAVGLALELTAEGVLVLREAYDALRLRDGPEAADVAASGWARAGSGKALFEAVRDDLTPEPLAPPHAGTTHLRPLRSKAELREAARRYRNCLGDRLSDAATGWQAFYEWEGPPGAIIGIQRDPIFGWRLEEARVGGNGAVPEAAREAIVSELALMGVHVGRSGWRLERLLRDDVGRGYRYWPPSQDVAEAFGDED